MTRQQVQDRGVLARWRWAVPAFSTVVLYAVAYVTCWAAFGIKIIESRVPYDLGLNLLLAFLVFSVSRRVWPFLLLQFLYFTVFYVGSALKIAMLGRPIMPEDVHNLAALIEILGAVGWLAIALPLAALACLFVFNLKFRARPAQAGWALLIALPLGAASDPSPLSSSFDRLFGNTPWDQRENFIWRGGALHFAQESLRTLAARRPIPTEEEVRTAVRRRAAASGGMDPLVPLGRRRNVHIILEESFWDPTILSKAGYSADPIDPRFRALWKQSNHTQALSPAFGGQTANAEFEVLCGLPVSQIAVKFEFSLLNDVPCLPRILSELGYRTVASHPNVAGFWNRYVAYGHLGFETFWAQDEMDMSDRNGPFLADRSLHRQISEKLQATGDGRPVFNYIVTIDGHWMYDAGKARPPVLTSTSKVKEVGDYANLLHYKSREMMDAIEAIQRDDPDALIVVFGDHLPMLGRKFAGYVESGLLPDNFGAFTRDQYDVAAATPLLVVDGRNGPMDLGRIPMYRLPGIILRLLGEERQTIFDLVQVPASVIPRPLPDVMLTYQASAPQELCKDKTDSASCAEAAAWLSDALLLDHDLFAGDQHALKFLGHAPPARDGLHARFHVN
ncbi:LTA synthase family protein [Dongia deserti]|uniref:LTA synthase family protein n=1 Tax=Dongia deserti TaxID=2268030 RepID=UPI0013C4D09B|nr:LTA synthase family protein [Dongia deserti]